MSTSKPRPKIFIDGSHGTTGLELAHRLRKVPEISLLRIPYSRRRDGAAREELYRKADLVVLCLPDEESASVVKVIEGIWKERGRPSPKILDTSSRFRTDKKWVYGHPQLWPEKIRVSSRVSNPGCYAIAMVSLIHPLVKKGWISSTTALTVFGVSGYSGGGSKMIADYRGNGKKASLLKAPLPYGLDLEHKHIPEMKEYSSLKTTPLFLPLVGPYYRGMVVMIPLPYSRFKKGIPNSKGRMGKILRDFYTGFYRAGQNISVKVLGADDLEGGKLLSPMVDHDHLEIFITARSDGDTVLIARLDNLGKGASGNALENISLMEGIEIKPPPAVGRDSR